MNVYCCRDRLHERAENLTSCRSCDPNSNVASSSLFSIPNDQQSLSMYVLGFSSLNHLLAVYSFVRLSLRKWSLSLLIIDYESRTSTYGLQIFIKNAYVYVNVQWPAKIASKPIWKTDCEPMQDRLGRRQESRDCRAPATSGVFRNLKKGVPRGSIAR